MPEQPGFLLREMHDAPGAFSKTLEDPLQLGTHGRPLEEFSQRHPLPFSFRLLLHHSRTALAQQQP
jgi:hypothetical protein